MVAARRSHAFVVSFCDRQRSAAFQIAGSSVSRTDPDAFDLGAAPECPGQRLLSSATSDHEHIAQRWQREGTGGGDGHGRVRNGG